MASFPHGAPLLITEMYMKGIDPVTGPGCLMGRRPPGR